MFSVPAADGSGNPLLIKFGPRTAGITMNSFGGVIKEARIYSNVAFSEA